MALVFPPIPIISSYEPGGYPWGICGRLQNTPPPAPWHHLHILLTEIGRVEAIHSYDESYLSIRTLEVLALIERDDPSWEAMVLPAVAQIIKTKGLFRTKSVPAQPA